MREIQRGEEENAEDAENSILIFRLLLLLRVLLLSALKFSRLTSAISCGMMA